LEAIKNKADQEIQEQLTRANTLLQQSLPFA
jgi:hypothetical protein